jgi:hypothetical protein
MLQRTTKVAQAKRVTADVSVQGNAETNQGWATIRGCLYRFQATEYLLRRMGRLGLETGRLRAGPCLFTYL